MGVNTEVSDTNIFFVCIDQTEMQNGVVTMILLLFNVHTHNIMMTKIDDFQKHADICFH